MRVRAVYVYVIRVQCTYLRIECIALKCKHWYTCVYSFVCTACVCLLGVGRVSDMYTWSCVCFVYTQLSEQVTGGCVRHVTHRGHLQISSAFESRRRWWLHRVLPTRTGLSHCAVSTSRNCAAVLPLGQVRS